MLNGIYKTQRKAVWILHWSFICWRSQ